MRKFSKKILIVSFLLTSVLIPLMESRGYVWTAPEPITDTISIQEDGEIDVFIDKTGKIHVAYVSTYYDVDTGLPLLDNELNYLNNYNMNGQETGFPLIEESALLCVNNEEDIYNITSIAKPSVSSDSESLAMVGFEGVLVETGTKEAWVSMIKNDSLSPEVLPLSHRNSTYSTSISEGINFKYIRNYGSDFIAVADNPTDPKIVTFSSINPQKNLTLNQLLYLDYPKHAEYNGSMLMVASGKNFLTFNVSNLDNIGASKVAGYYGFSESLSKFYYDFRSNSVLIPVNTMLYWLNVSDISEPKLINSINLETTGQSAHDILSISESETTAYLYIAAGLDGLIAVRFNRETGSLQKTQQRKTVGINYPINGIAYNFNDTLYLAGGNGIYTSKFENNEFNNPRSLTKVFDTPTTANNGIDFNNNTKNLACAHENGTITVWDSAAILNESWSVYMNAPALDIILLDDYIYATVETNLNFGGIRIINVATNAIVSGVNDNYNPLGCNPAGLTRNGTNLILSDYNSGVVALSISTPNQVVQRGITLDTLPQGGSIHIAQNKYIYIVDQNPAYGLTILDATDNFHDPNVLAIQPLPTKYSGGLYALNNWIYITGGSDTNGFIAINATRMSRLNITDYSSYSTSALNDIFVQQVNNQTWAYATDDTNDYLRFFNLTSNFYTPTETGNTAAILSPKTMIFDNNNLYIAMNTGVRIYSLSNPYSPTPSGLIGTTAAALDIALDMGVIYVALGASGIDYFDIETGSVHNQDPAPNVNAIAAYSACGYGTSAAHGIVIFDCSAHGSFGNFINHGSVSVSFFNNGTAVALWRTNGGIYYRYIRPDYSRSRIYEFTTGSNLKLPQIEIAHVNSTEFTHIVYLNGSDYIFHSWRMNNGTFSTSAIFSTAAAYEMKMDANRDTIGVVFRSGADNDIFILLSTSNGSSWPGTPTPVCQTSGGVSESNPDLYVKPGGKAEVVYQRAIGSNSTIFMRQNFDGEFDKEEYIVEYLPGLNSQSLPIIAERNGSVVVFYQNNIKDSEDKWGQSKIFAFGYQTLRYDYTGDYTTLIIRDDPAGTYLFEGIRMTFNSTGPSGVYYNFTIRIVDTVTENEWINHTIVPATGVISQEYRFFSPDNYFITNHDFELYLYNGSDFSQYLIKVPFSGFEYTYPESIYYYNSSNNVEEGWYSLLFEPIFEYGNQLIMDLNGLENEKNPVFRFLGPNNYADLWYFPLKADREYNFYLIDNNALENATLHVFDANIQITNASQAIFSLNSTNLPTDPVRFKAPYTGDFVALIQPLKGSYYKSFEYKFYLSAIPLSPYNLEPKNKTFVGLSNPLLGYEPIELSWSTYSVDSDISRYRLEIYNTSNIEFATPVLSTTIWGMESRSYTYNAVVEQEYYWRVMAIDKSTPSNLGTWSQLNVIYFDRTNPNAPVLFSLGLNHTLSYITISWADADDGIYSVEKYYLYMATRPVFIEGANASAYEKYLITPNGISVTSRLVEQLKNYHYYFAVDAVDHVGLHSGLSNIVDVPVAIGGFVSAANQNLSLQIGDTLVYEVTYVDSKRENTEYKKVMSFFYSDFTPGTQFHFWVQVVNKNDVYPIISQFYARDPLSAFDTSWRLIDDETPLQLLALSPSVQYQKEVFTLFNRTEFHGQKMEYANYETLWRSGTVVVEVVVHTFLGEIVGDYQSSLSFFVEKSTGIVVQMTYFNRNYQYGENNFGRYGYCLMLMLDGTSVEFPTSQWKFAPIYFAIGCLALASIISAIIKKVEY